MPPWILCIILGLICANLAFRRYSVRRDTHDILSELSDLIRADTNQLLCVSSSDKTVRAIADELNRQLTELRRLRRQYENGDRELKEAVTNISHDLRTPLTAICGYLELLDREPKSETSQRYLGCISERVEAMKQLTEELFRYSVIISTSEDMSIEPLDVRAALEESIAGFYVALTERGIEPKITIPEDKIIRNLNSEAVSRIYGNILSNALKYSDGDLEIIMNNHGDVSFSNTAKNLGGVDVGKLFDRFFSVEAARNSTGLGLAISKTLVEQMGGSVTAAMDGEILTITVKWVKDNNDTEKVSDLPQI